MNEHYWILGKDRGQVIAFAKANNIKPKDYTYIFHPHQFRRFTGKILIVLREVFTGQPFEPLQLELLPIKKTNTVIKMWSTEKLTEELIWKNRPKK